MITSTSEQYQYKYCTPKAIDSIIRAVNREMAVDSKITELSMETDVTHTIVESLSINKKEVDFIDWLRTIGDLADYYKTIKQINFISDMDKIDLSVKLINYLSADAYAPYDELCRQFKVDRAFDIPDLPFLLKLYLIERQLNINNHITFKNLLIEYGQYHGLICGKNPKENALAHVQCYISAKLKDFDLLSHLELKLRLTHDLTKNYVLGTGLNNYQNALETIPTLTDQQYVFIKECIDAL